LNKSTARAELRNKKAKSGKRHRNSRLHAPALTTRAVIFGAVGDDTRL
jgi:hypothetical protein